MKLTLFSPDSFSTTILPAKCAGQYWLTLRDDPSSRIIAVEGNRSLSEDTPDQWILKSNSQYRIISPKGHQTNKVTLDYQSVYMISSADGSEKYILYTEPLSNDRKAYLVYKVNAKDASIRIGRNPSCDICYDCDYIGSHHATIKITGSGMTVTDNDSRNGTFVNGRRVKTASLQIGDVVYAMGMQIIVTTKFLYINNPDRKVTIRSDKLLPYHMPRFELPEQNVDDILEQSEFDDFYYRAPRFKSDVEPLTLKLDPPPTGNTSDNMPMLMSIGPSITMGMASATTAAFSVVNAISSGNFTTAIPSVVMSLGMLSGTLLWPTLTKNYQRKTAAQKEAARQASYRSYLNRMEDRVNQEIGAQERILRENDVSCSEYLNRLHTQPLQIWDRTNLHNDFLRLRLGSGQMPLQADIQYPERHFTVEEDDLQEYMYQFGEKKRWLQNVPICLSLAERTVSGFYANHALLLEYAKNLILQLTVLHSYDEVKLVVLYDKEDEEQFSFVRWLPHTMDNDRQIRYLASTLDEVNSLSADLEKIIDYRKALNQEQLKDELPTFVVLCTSKKLGAKAEFMRSLMQSKDNLGFSVITMYERLKDLPKECSAVIRLDPNQDSTLTLLDDVAQAPVMFRMELPTNIDMQDVAKILSNTILDVADSSFQLPKKYTFLDMLDVGMVDHLNLLENWSVNDPTKTLAAPIGIDVYGDPVVLDLHERAHGPHGLVAGMTGSGKSETIIAYILSMAIHYHPNEVAFILIDYKGGGMAKAFENIPHTAGIITNLDGNAINRSLVSMQSELHRREGIFREVSQKHGISNIDIYKYQKLYREKKVSEPLPHLIIISDEFAELKKDQPDFMDALTSTARVGRSLGVHLILATQKPGGVVDDQIRSNSRFRLCLKVQDRGDSTEMMGRPEASSLVDTGRFYLQVGNNEVFKLGQSAWAGASYYPAPKPAKELNDAVSIIDKNGRTLMEINTDRYAHIKDARKQLDVITEYIHRISVEEQIDNWKMWLDPIPAQITAEYVWEKYPEHLDSGFTLNPSVGEYDDPAHQRQDALTIPLTASGNVIVYGAPGSGKTMFLESMCYSLMHRHTPDEVNLYIMDFGAETMTEFSDAPHTGDVILPHEADKIDNLFKLLASTLARRKKLMSRSGGSFAQYNEQSTEKHPNILVMIHNFANFSELCDQHLGDLAYLTREGTRYGIYFILTCTGVNNVRLNMQQNFKSIYCLQLNNSSDYSVIVGKTGGLIPAKNPGRGMFRYDKDSVLEFQIAGLPNPAHSYTFYQDFSRNLCSRYHKKAARIPTLPERVDAMFLAPSVQPNDLRHVPVGVEKESMRIAQVNLEDRPVHVILSQDQSYMKFTAPFAEFLADHYNGQTHLLAPAGISETIRDNQKLHKYTTQAECVEGVNELFQQVLKRNNAYKTAVEAGQPAPTFEPMFVVIQSISELQLLLERSTVENPMFPDDSMMQRLLLAVNKCSKEYNAFILIADSEANVRSFSGLPECKSQISKQDFIWIGNGISSQYWWNVTQKPQGYTATLDKHFGFCVNGGNAILVKFLQTEEDDV